MPSGGTGHTCTHPAAGHSSWAGGTAARAKGSSRHVDPCRPRRAAWPLPPAVNCSVDRLRFPAAGGSRRARVPVSLCLYPHASFFLSLFSVLDLAISMHLGSTTTPYTYGYIRLGRVVSSFNEASEHATAPCTYACSDARDAYIIQDRVVVVARCNELGAGPPLPGGFLCRPCFLYSSRGILIRKISHSNLILSFKS